MTILIVLFTILLIVDCLFLGLLILIQLPKKEAGAGVAFGGGATDALFGAGSGTALSNLTKYTATAFFVLVFALSILNTHARHSDVSALKRQMEKQNALPMPAPSSPAPAPATPPPASTSATMPLMISTNAVAPTTTPATNTTAAPAK
jgi:protein translocase SecG subunit